MIELDPLLKLIHIIYKIIGLPANITLRMDPIIPKLQVFIQKKTKLIRILILF